MSNDKQIQYPVTINYGMSLRQMIIAGKYDWKDDAVNWYNFTAEGEGVVHVDLELVHFPRVVTTREVEEELDNMGLRSARIEELLAFGATYPEIQLEFSIFALGSSFPNDAGYRYSAFLGKNNKERAISTWWRIDPWAAGIRFLAVRK